MLFVLFCLDKPDSAGVRADTRDAHLDYIGSFKANMVMAGPMLAEDGSHSVGSLLVMDFPDRAAAEAFSAGDPYTQAGLFESVFIRPYKKLFPGD